MAISTVIHTNQHSVDRVLNAGAPVLLVFAAGAGPLPGSLGAALDALAARFAGKLLVARVDAREESGLVQRFAVRQTPCVVILRGGEVLERLAGAIRTADLEAWAHYLIEGGRAPAPSRPSPQAEESPSPTTAGGGGHPLVLTDATFVQTLRTPLPVLVDFWAPWCGPCRMIAPSVERLAGKYAGRAVVAKMNVDENPLTPGQFGIRGIPTLLIFKGGNVVEQIVGAQPYDQIEQRLARHAV
ncbi:MAG: thioredoxin [Caldilineaceae bacterium]